MRASEQTRKTGAAGEDGLPRATTENLAKWLGRLAEMSGSGGPRLDEFDDLAEIFHELWRNSCPTNLVSDALSRTMTVSCMQGFSRLQPHGYAGDFEIIDRIYTDWVSVDPSLARWDLFFHAQPAPIAVRNRKSFFKALIRQRSLYQPSMKVLNLGSGPGRDVLEHYQDDPSSDVRIHCVDLDGTALAYAQHLLADHHDRVTFEKKNVLRHRPDSKYDVIWSAGLFDYFADDAFRTMLRRLYKLLAPGGEVIVGNFSPENPSRAYMELVAEWNLVYRTAERLRSLAVEAGAKVDCVAIDNEALGINLFLRVRVSEAV